MRRSVATVLLALAMINIAHADILHPCQCGPDNPYSCGCAASKAERPAPQAPC